MRCVVPTNRSRDLGHRRKWQVKALPAEPPRPVPIPVEISAVIGVYFSDQSGNSLLPLKTLMLIDLKVRRKENGKR